MTQEERILDIRADFITSMFGSGIRAGRSYAVTCPKCCGDEHRKRKKKLSIRLDSGMHHCWICGLKGKTLLYTVRKFHPSRLEEYGRIFDEKDYQIHLGEHDEQEIVLSLPEGFVPLVSVYKSHDPDIRDVVRYLERRGLNLGDFFRWRLGTCVGGKFCRRVIMPSFDSEGELNYYTARSIDSDGAKKYVNSKVKRKDVIFNELNVKWSEPLVLVEGPFDLTKCGWNAVAMLGSFLDESYILFRKIVTSKTDVILVLDQDAGQKMIKIAEGLASYGINVKCINLNTFNDVGEMSKEDFEKILETAYSWSDTSRLESLIGQIRSGSIL